MMDAENAVLVGRYNFCTLRGRPVRLLGVGMSHFELVKRQFELWSVATEPSEPQALKATLDKLPERFGNQAFRKGRDLKD